LLSAGTCIFYAEITDALNPSEAHTPHLDI